VLTKYDRVVNKLFRQGTKRRGIYDLGLTGVRTIVNEGWRSFFNKATRKMKLWVKSIVSMRRDSLRTLLTLRLPLAVFFGVGSDRLCPCCGCRGVTFRTPVMRIQRNYFGCCNCFYYRTEPIPSPEQLSKYYAEDYDYMTYEHSNEEIVLRAHDVLQWLDRVGFSKLPKRVLEIGPAGGGIIAGLAQFGCEVIGIDISESVRDGLHERFGINVLVSEDPKEAMALIPDKRFDLIIVDHVLEHLIDPFATLSTISRLLTEDGYCFIKVPNAFGLEAVLQGNQWVWLDPLGHIHNWSPRSMRKAVIRAGLEPVLDGTLQGRPLLRNISNKKGFVNCIVRTLYSPRWLDSFVTRSKLGCNYHLIVKRASKLYAYYQS
jgi:2-polyprenyl-3-methyl-5-hydroxy-6-metoxy-1,4-benzoquinol methylase